VSVKDRGAIAMAGHAGKAFWFSKQAGEFVTSRFYYDAYPDWVTAFNAGQPAQRYADTHWELMHNPETYRFAERDDQPWETDFPGYGRTFPHAFGPGDGKYFTTLLTVSPAGDELVRDFAEELIVREQIGQDDITDFLSVSFSSTDYVGHLFGPSSLEAEDNLRRLDRTLAGLLAFVDERVGAEHTLIVFSADHGGPDAPGFMNQYGIESELVDPESWDTTPGLTRLKARFGLGDELIQTYFHPYVYLDKVAIAEAGLDLAKVETAVANELVLLDGVAAAFTYSDLMTGNVPDTRLTRAVLHNHNPQRSGEIFIVFEPHRFIADFDGLHVASTHGSPWAYDTFVPIIFAGSGLEPRTIHRRVHTVDIAPTLSAIIGTKPPSGAAGDPLVEVLQPLQ
jgi:predicted AlkP superfamily pyrophosphatase or phosphodiesterase